MPTHPIFEPAFDVCALNQLAAGHLVRFAGKGNKDELAFTAVEELEGEEERLLVVLNRKNSNGETFPPMVFPAAASAQPSVAVFPEWRIEPVEVVVTNAESNRENGIILASGSGDAHLVASQMLDHQREPQVGVRPDTGKTLGTQAFQDWKSKNDYVAVTEWKLWVPQFSDGERPGWKPIFEFPQEAVAAKS